MSEDDEQTIQEAIKNIEKRRAGLPRNQVRATIVPGGSTGLVQQGMKPYPPESKSTEPILPWIKDNIKKEFNIDVVLMAGGIGYSAVEEDAEFMNRNFGNKIHDVGGTRPYVVTTTNYYGKKEMIEKHKKPVRKLLKIWNPRKFYC